MELAPHDAAVAAAGRAHLGRLEVLVARLIAPDAPDAAADRARALIALAIGTLTLRKAGAPAGAIRAALSEADRLLHI